MCQLQPAGVQGDATAKRLAATVLAVTQDRTTAGGQLDSDLVLASGQQFDLQPAPAAMPSYTALGRFYLPLAMTPLIALSVHPVVTFFLGHGNRPLESLAIMPVLYALTFVFRALGLSFPEVAIATLKDGEENRTIVRRFAIYLAAGLGGGLSLIAFTPLNVFWYATVSGLPDELVHLAIPPLQILALFPTLTVAIGYQRALLINRGITLPVTVATAIEAAGIFLVLALLISYSALPGVTAAALAYLLGRLMALLYLCWPVAAARDQPKEGATDKMREGG